MNKENQELALKVTEINQSKQEQLEASKSSLENISREFQLVRQEKEELQGSFGLLQTELQKEQHLYQQLKQRAEETLRSEHQHVESLLIQLKEADSQKKLLEQRVQQVCQEKLKLVQQSDQQILELKKNIDQMQSDFKQEIECMTSKLTSNELQLSKQFDTIAVLEVELLEIQKKLATSEDNESKVKAEKTEISLALLNLEQQYFKLQENHEKSLKEFQAQMETTASKLESASSNISELVLLNSSTKSQLETVLNEKILAGIRYSELEAKHNQLCSERDILQERISHIIAQTQQSQKKLDDEKNKILAELELKTRELEDKESFIKSTEKKYEEAQQRINSLESSIKTLSQNADELRTSEAAFKQEVSELQTAIASARLELQSSIEETNHKEILLIQKSKIIESFELNLNEVLSTERNLKSQLSQVQNEKSELSEEKTSLQAEISRLLLLQEDKENYCYQLLESEEKLTKSYNHQIGEIKLELEKSVSEKNVLHNNIRLLAVKLEDEQKKGELLINAQKAHQEDFDRRLEEQIREHAHQLKQLSTELADARQLHSSIERKCEQMEARQVELELERSNLEQMYQDLKSSFERAEATLQRSGEEVSTLRRQLDQRSEKIKQLELTIETFQDESKATESNHLNELQALKAEKTSLLDFQARLEEKHQWLSQSLKTSQEEFEEKLREQAKAVLDGDCLRKEIEDQYQDLRRSIEQLELELKSVKQEKLQLLGQFSDLRSTYTVAVEELERMKVDFRATEIHLSDTNQSVRNLELQTEQLTTEIQELSNKKADLELFASQLQDSLESVKAIAETKSNKLKGECESQKAQIETLSKAVELSEIKFIGVQSENECLRTKVLEFEETKTKLIGTISSLKASDFERQKLFIDLTDSKTIQEKLQQNLLKTQETIKTLEKQLHERDEALHRIGKELDLEKDRSSTAQAKFIEALTQSQQEKKAVLQSEATLNREIVDLKCAVEKKDGRLKECVAQLKSLKLQLDSSLTVNKNIDDECCRFKRNLFQVTQEKSALEQECRDIKSSLQVIEENLGSKLEFIKSELQSKEKEILRISNQLALVQVQLKEMENQKVTLEKELEELKRSFKSEKEMSLTSKSLLEDENQQVKAELAAEKEKYLLVRGETALEHRKEKAGLEARLQLALIQVKSMQEKLVAMTVANQAQAPLENKITSLTSELQAVCKTKTELEKKLQQATDGVESEADLVKKEQVIIKVFFILGIFFLTNYSSIFFFIG